MSHRSCIFSFYSQAVFQSEYHFIFSPATCELSSFLASLPYLVLL